MLHFGGVYIIKIAVLSLAYMTYCRQMIAKMEGI